MRVAFSHLILLHGNPLGEHAKAAHEIHLLRLELLVGGSDWGCWFLLCVCERERERERESAPRISNQQCSAEMQQHVFQREEGEGHKKQRNDKK
jgi:hypothetical protein